jgi:hypothetical protein
MLDVAQALHGRQRRSVRREIAGLSFMLKARELAANSDPGAPN